MADYKNLVEMFETAVKKFGPNDLFGTKKNGVWTWSSYSDVGKKVDQLRGGLASLGVKRGDKVVIICDNREEWAVTAYACYGLGAALVPMYEAQSPKEWEFIANDCGASLVVAGSKKVLDIAKDLPKKVETIKHVVGIPLPKDDPASFEALLAKGAESPVPSIQPENKDTACLIYTSGTTGNPKGVILSHGNFISNVNAVQELLPIGRDDRSLSFLPWAHSFGHTCEMLVMVSTGASVAFAEAIDKIIPNLAEVRPTMLFSVPRIWNRIYDGVNKQISERPPIVQKLVFTGIKAANKKHRGEPVSFVESAAHAIASRLVFDKIRGRLGGRMKYAFSGGAALSREVAEFIDGIGITVYEGYGLTETSPIATANRPGAQRIGTVGKAIKDVKIVIDKTATGEEKQGEIVVYGPNVMQGYHNRPEENQAVFTEDGGFRTGDLGFLDEEGYLHITGRLKELYKLQNGKYVAPAPLEEKLKLSPAIANVMVYGDNQLFNIALIVPEMSALKAWASENGVSGSDEELCNDPKVQAHMLEEVKKAGESFKGFEEIKKIVLAHEDFTVENGLLTPSLKLKRRVAMQKYGEKIAALYK
jgi:long-chain acyl-CoA synthetase